MSPRPAPLALSGAHVVVTGASRGIGAALAREMAARGATVTVVARSDVPLKALAADIGGQAVQADLAEAADLDGLVARIEAGAGPVDVLVNNAAVAVVNRLVDQSPDDIRQSFALNCVAPAELCRQVLPGMLARGRGRIVCVSSLSGLTAFPTLTTYGATKAGLTHFTAALQRELRRTPVRATIVQLGEVSGTELMEQARRSPTIAAVSARLNRVRALPTLTPEQVAAQIADAAAAGARHLVTPTRVTPVHLIRELPSRLNDGLLAGID
ncbi:MAG TPA: SDR family NAD(P)-dependent oxidoreductase [Acidimicrobiia bacterium]|nr:SDR family NAD(P)-dependent oxidoreductase [Acidimicrobiia bacterium]